MTLEVILAVSNIKKTITKMQSSMDEIQRVNPHRTDLINSLRDSIHDLEESLFIFQSVVDELRLESKSAFRNQHLALIKTKELDRLQDIISNYKVDL